MNKCSIAKYYSKKKEVDKSVCDFTVDGKCSNCGECCSDFLPLTIREIDIIKAYVKKYKIKEEIHSNVLEVSDSIQMTCPFNDKKNHKCNIYKVRPSICKVFICNKPFDQILKTKKEYFQNNYRKPTSLREVIYGKKNQLVKILENIRGM